MLANMNNQGFSMIEMLFVLAVISVLLFIGLPSYNSMRDDIALKNDSHEIVNALRVAQRRSVVSQGGVTHGVNFATSTYTLFDGDWSMPDKQVEYKLAGGIEILSGAGQTIVFNRLTGDTMSSTTIVLGTSGDFKNINIKKTGNIDIN